MVVTISLEEFEALVKCKRKLGKIDAIIFCHNVRDIEIKENKNNETAEEVVHKIEFEAVCTLEKIKGALKEWR